MMSAYSISNQDISLFLDLHFCSIQINESTTLRFTVFHLWCKVWSERREVYKILKLSEDGSLGFCQSFRSKNSTYLTCFLFG